MIPLNKQKIAVLGEGLTATAVRKKMADLHIPEVPVQKASLIIASPGIPPENYPANIQGEVISEIDFAYKLFDETNAMPMIIGVTGTNGKSTVTSLIAHILECPASGNIGTPLIEFVGKHPAKTPIVVELSSYQLEQSHTFRSHIAVLLNLTEDHLERHKTMHEYGQAKAKIFTLQTTNDFLIYNQDDPKIIKLITEKGPQKIPYSLTDPEANLLHVFPLPGQHNVSNALSAYKVAKILTLSEQEILEKMKTFKGLEHRIEFVTLLNQCPVYNDSKATNPDATLKAVCAFDKPVHLILCGYDKGLPLDSFIKILHQTVKTITVFGGITTRFTQCSQRINSNFPIAIVKDIKSALIHILETTLPEEIILFSPACSSFDQFKNFEDRGTQFKHWVSKTYGEN